jgi:Arc/MetJ family transcription regulator
MATNLALDDDLISEVQKLGKFKTKREAVTKAMIEYVNKHKQQEIIELFGKVDYDKAYDPKAGRD